MKKQVLIPLAGALVFVALVSVAVFHVRTVKAQNAVVLPARVSYTAKFVCGYEPPSPVPPVLPAEPPVKPGNYATVINLHNPWAQAVKIQKQVAIAAPETFPNTKLVPPTRRFPDSLPSEYGMSINCTEIVNLLTLNGTPPTTTFIEGWVMVDSFISGPPPASGELDVIEVTTTSNGPNAAGVINPVSSHEITILPGRSLPAGTWPI